MAISGEGILKRSIQVYLVDPLAVEVDEKANYRQEYTEIPELAENILENGLLTPLVLYKRKDGTLELIDGFRRMRAIKYLIDSDRETFPKGVKAVIETAKQSDEDLLIRRINANEGIKPSALELCEAYKRLLSFDFTQKEIAKRVGKTPAHVSYILGLQGASEETKKAIVNKEIPVSEAVKIVKKTNGNADQKAAVEKAKADKAAKKAAKAAAPKPPKTLAGGFAAPPPPKAVKDAEEKPKARQRSGGDATDFVDLAALLAEEIKEFDSETVEDMEGLRNRICEMIETLEKFYANL